MDWIPIGEPNVPELSPDAKAVRDYITENCIAQITGKTAAAMCRALHMGIDRFQDAVYEYRKWEAIMSRRPKINKEQRTEMLRLHNEERYSVGKLASKYGCSQTAVKTALQAAKIEAEDATLDKHTPHICIASSCAVDEAQIKDIAAEGAELEDCENGIPNTPLVPAEIEKEISANAESEALPFYITDALAEHIRSLSLEIEEREQRVAELQAEIEDYQFEREKIAAWLEEHT